MDETGIEDQDPADVPEASDDAVEREYGFDGYRIELFEKVALTPPALGNGPD